MERTSIPTKAVDVVHELLLKCGGRTPRQLAEALNLPPIAVRYALKELQERGDLQLSRPFAIPATPLRVVPSRVPETITLKAADRLEKARLLRSRVHLRQEEIRKGRREAIRSRRDEFLSL